MSLKHQLPPERVTGASRGLPGLGREAGFALRQAMGPRAPRVRGTPVRAASSPTSPLRPSPLFVVSYPAEQGRPSQGGVRVGPGGKGSVSRSNNPNSSHLQSIFNFQTT